MNSNPYKTPTAQDKKRGRLHRGLMVTLLYANIGFVIACVLFGAMQYAYSAFESQNDLLERYAAYDAEVTVVGPSTTFYFMLVGFNLVVAYGWWRVRRTESREQGDNAR